jgi:hypothetical protein
LSDFQKWEKLGQVFSPDNYSNLMVRYARIPIADYYKDDTFDVYFGSRDRTNRERIFKLKFDLSRLEVVDIFENPILNFGETLGAFDDNGVSPCCILNIGRKKFLYYAGWNVHVKIPFTCAVGLAISDDNGESFKRKFKGPVLDRNKYEHQFVAVNDVMVDEGLFKSWYLSCSKWEYDKNSPNKLVHYYAINYAESENGSDWKQTGEMAVGFKNKYEYAISTPRVIKEPGGSYGMWYSYRAQKDVETYRIGYATSYDGRKWVRQDETVGLDVSKAGWDSEMVCYPFVFSHKGNRYMLYNGNSYGKTGFGIAVLNE